MSAAVRLLIGLACLGLATCNITQELQSLNQLKEKKAPFKACIDDSDCAEHGSGWACFQYICYPWQDDSKVEAKHRMKTCKTDSHCDQDLSCHRHPDRRNILKGLCMEPVVDCSENGRSDCKNNGPARSCCNSQWCCADEYFHQLKSLPCGSHEGCKDMGYGNFCCPQANKGNETMPSVCCNEDPNPPPVITTKPPKRPASSASSLLSPFTFIAFLIVLASLRQ